MATPLPTEHRPIAWQDTVVDIQATSRYDTGDSSPDIANVTITIALAGDDREGDVAFTIDDRTEVHVAQQGGLVRLSMQKPVTPDEDGTYRFSMTVPEPWASLVKGGDMSTTVLLPRAYAGGASGSGYEVELRSWSREGDPQVFGTKDQPGIATRQAVAWYLRADPEIDLGYGYISV
ncbi:MAG: hypothetical protein M3123_04185 [Actinomycetota bacterium]|nr:hypothetical protein [Actinomycetota bacterium]